RIDLEDLALYANWPLERVRRADIERDIEAGRAILECYRLFPQDVFIIASQSGVNAAIVEVARQVKERGHALVAVTSLDHTQHVQSRHPSGEKLYELADIVIDNCGPYGDALLNLPTGGNVCAVSSLSTMLIAEMLTAETIHALLERGVEPLVYVSA
ncbi:MAG TPA: sugar isomerase, partial [Ktedonobacter sp.]|nr:sugar isomerase [Ktedonobacter sp.]